MVKMHLIILLNLLASLSVLAADEESTAVSFNGQATGWGIAQWGNPVSTDFGARFVPTLQGSFNLMENTQAAFEASLNLHASIGLSGFDFQSKVYSLKPYRLWMRLSSEQWELRAGLQKINFGSAKMFRPLMWFDRMDVRDPLQLTDGVKGILAKYFYENNANLWIWGLIGNTQPKGYERWGSVRNKPEVGGRLELPTDQGEVAISTHFRSVNYGNLPNSVIPGFEATESRLGLDGKWDVGIGLWFEASTTHADLFSTGNSSLYPYQTMWNFGADYTLPLGHGLGVTAEYFGIHMGEQFLDNGINMHVLGSMFTYPLTLLDNLSAMVFWVPQNGQCMNYLNWGRTYDNWSLYLMAYANPSNVQLVNIQTSGRNLFAGKGIQLMVNYNF